MGEFLYYQYSNDKTSFSTALLARDADEAVMYQAAAELTYGVEVAPIAVQPEKATGIYADIMAGREAFLGGAGVDEHRLDQAWNRSIAVAEKYLSAGGVVLYLTAKSTRGASRYPSTAAFFSHLADARTANDVIT